jgi:hypothetical protein
MTKLLMHLQLVEERHVGPNGRFGAPGRWSLKPEIATVLRGAHLFPVIFRISILVMRTIQHRHFAVSHLKPVDVGEDSGNRP